MCVPTGTRMRSARHPKRRVRKARKKALPSRVRSTQKRHCTKEKPRGMKCVNHRLPLPGACTFARFAMEWNLKKKKKEKNATLAVHSHLSCRAWEPAQCLFDFPRGTLRSKWDSMTDICIPEDKVLGILLIGVEQTLCQRVSYCIIVCTLGRHLTEFLCLTGCEWEPAAISSVAKGHINC